MKWDASNILPLGDWHCEHTRENRTILDKEKDKRLPSLLMLQLEIEKENEAIKFNRCSLACTSVAKGTIFFSSHLVIVIFYLSQGNPSQEIDLLSFPKYV